MKTINLASSSILNLQYYSHAQHLVANTFSLYSERQLSFPTPAILFPASPTLHHPLFHFFFLPNPIISRHSSIFSVSISSNIMFTDKSHTGLFFFFFSSFLPSSIHLHSLRFLSSYASSIPGPPPPSSHLSHNTSGSSDISRRVTGLRVEAALDMSLR